MNGTVLADLPVNGPIEKARQVLANFSRYGGLIICHKSIDQLVNVGTTDVLSKLIAPDGQDMQPKDALYGFPGPNAWFDFLRYKSLKNGLKIVAMSDKVLVTAFNSRVAPLGCTAKDFLRLLPCLR